MVCDRIATSRGRARESHNDSSYVGMTSDIDSAQCWTQIRDQAELDNECRMPMLLLANVKCYCINALVAFIIAYCPHHCIDHDEL